MTNYADVLAILVRLRQYCCHPSLVGKYTGGGMHVDYSYMHDSFYVKCHT